MPGLVVEGVMAASPDGASPRAGDIIMSRMGDGSHRYALSTLDEALQVLCATREEAVAQAHRFARTHRVDVWQTEDGTAFTRMFETRPASSM